MAGLKILRTATVLLSGYILFAVFRFSIGLILPGVTLEFQLSPTESGVFASAPLLTSVLTMAGAGYISDRISRKVTLSIGMLVMWAGALLCSFAPNYLLALSAVLIAGAGAGFVPPTVYSIMGDLQPGSRATLTGITAGTYNLGGFAGAAGLGFATAMSGWRPSLAVLSGLGLTCLVIVFLFMESSTNSQGPGTRMRSPSSPNVSILKSKNVVLAGMSLFMATYACFAMISWAPTYLIHLGTTPGLAGIVIGVFSLAGGATSIALGRLADARGEKPLILTTGAVAGIVCIVLFFYGSNFISIAVLLALLGLLVWPSWNLTTSMAQRLVGPASVGSITGLVQTFGMAGGFLGPLLTGGLVSYFGLGPVLFGSAAVTLWLYSLFVIPFKEASWR